MSKKTRRNIAPYLGLILVLAAIYVISTMMTSKVHNMNYSTFMKNLKNNKVETVELSPNTKGSIYEITGKMKGYGNKESYYTTAPLVDDTVKTLNEYRTKNNFKIKINSDPQSSIFFTFLINVVPYLLIGGALLWFLNKQIGANSKSMDLVRVELNYNQIKIK